MKKIWIVLLPVVVFLMVVSGGEVWAGSNEAFVDTGGYLSPNGSTLEKNITQLGDLAPGVREKVARQLRLSNYQITRCEKTLPSGKTSLYQATNHTQKLNAYFTGQGIEVLPAEGSERAWQVAMALSGYGYGETIEPIQKLENNAINVSGGRVEYRRGQLTEWYMNDEQGLEQGISLYEPPAGKAAGRLVVEWDVASTLVAQVEPAGRGIAFSEADGETVLRYSGLKAWDATGRSLPAKLEVRDSDGLNRSYRIAYVVDDTRATYPVMIDPVFTEVQKVLPSDGAAGDWFGYAVSISGDTMVVGAHNDDDNGSDSGAAYIFYRNQGGADTWGQVAKITASDGAAGDYFGWSVSVSNDTVVVGAYGDDDNGSSSGAAYIFYRNQGGADTWGQVAKITADDGAADDYFGYSVSASGDTVVVGAYQDDGTGSDFGAAYMFYRNQGVPDTWDQVKKITPTDGAAYDYFGYSVSVSGDTVVVGAWGDDDNGSSSGAAYVFDRDLRGINNWGQVRKITPTDGAELDNFGYSVNISNDTVVVGGYGGSYNGNGSGAYIFYRNQGGVAPWVQVAKIAAGDGFEQDRFGSSVSISGDTVVVGALWDDDNGFRSGSAYIFDRNQGGADAWGQVEKITADDGAANDYFGSAVSISGDTVVVGAWGDDDNGSNSGSAYIFERIATSSAQLPAIFLLLLGD